MASTAALEPGSVFARDYRVVRPLAEGGMGAVYVVEQISTRKRRALKLIKPGTPGLAGADDKAVERFVQEATVASEIQSEHVVQVIAAGVESGTPWIVMELLEGEDLAARVERAGALPPAEAVELFAQLCHGLGAAHTAGVVHRDLKPENVFVARALRAGAPFTVKLLDFGIAKMLEHAGTSARTTSVIGSPLWMAPEQFNAGAIRPCTDVWPLGLIAFWALTGRYYWVVANREDAALTPLMTEQLFAPLVPASSRALELGASPAVLPPGFDAWFARAVVREPEARFSDANAAAAALLPLFGTAHAGAWQLASAPGAAFAVASVPPPPVSHAPSAPPYAPAPTPTPFAMGTPLPATAAFVSTGSAPAPIPVATPAHPYAQGPSFAPAAPSTGPVAAPASSTRWLALAGLAVALGVGAFGIAEVFHDRSQRAIAEAPAPAVATAVPAGYVLVPQPAAPTALPPQPAAAPPTPPPATPAPDPATTPRPSTPHAARVATRAASSASAATPATPTPRLVDARTFTGASGRPVVRDQNGDVVHQSWGLPTRTEALNWSGVAFISSTLSMCEHYDEASLAVAYHDPVRAHTAWQRNLDAIRRALNTITEERDHYANDPPVARHLQDEYDHAVQLVRARCPDALR